MEFEKFGSLLLVCVRMWEVLVQVEDGLVQASVCVCARVHACACVHVCVYTQLEAIKMPISKRQRKAWTQIFSILRFSYYWCVCDVGTHMSQSTLWKWEQLWAAVLFHSWLLNSGSQVYKARVQFLSVSLLLLPVSARVYVLVLHYIEKFHLFLYFNLQG